MQGRNFDDDGSEPQKILKAVVLGNSGVGKSSLIRAMNGNGFDSRHSPTRSITVTDVDLSGEILAGEDGDVPQGDLRAQLWDCDITNFAVVSSKVLSEAGAILVVYDVTDFKSFADATTKWLDVAFSRDDDDVFIVLLGSKTDNVAERAVDIKEAEQIANRHGLCFMEVSSKEGTNIDLVSSLLQIRSSRRQMQQEASPLKLQLGNANEGLEMEQERIESRNYTDNAMDTKLPITSPPDSARRQGGPSSPTRGLYRKYTHSSQVSSSYATINSILGRPQGLTTVWPMGL